ncbi:MAG: rhodanese-like domain-containing protein [Gluconacetobacter diazotrophicus]|nr:rhodanese-like domain-containing protein [Gluconacetobacter diazotrophicus]
MVEDVSPQQCFEALRADQAARLVDVRTEAEWAYVGVPDLSVIGGRTMLVPWQSFPTGRVNADFVAQLEAGGAGHDQTLFFICRSGARSLAAAEAARRAGYARVFNVADGFEGPPDVEGHRGTVAGWKSDGLPWRQG